MYLLYFSGYIVHEQGQAIGGVLAQNAGSGNFIDSGKQIRQGTALLSQMMQTVNRVN
jgi:hypothetical protein